MTGLPEQYNIHSNTPSSGNPPYLMVTAPCLMATLPYLMVTAPCLMATLPYLMATAPYLMATLPYFMATTLTSRQLPLTSWQPSLTSWQPPLPHGNPPLPHGNCPLPHGNPSLPHGNPSLPHGNPSLPHGNPSLPHSNCPLPHGNPPLPHGNPSLPHGNPPYLMATPPYLMATAPYLMYSVGWGVHEWLQVDCVTSLSGGDAYMLERKKHKWWLQTTIVKWGKGSMCWKNTHKWWSTNRNGPIRERLYVLEKHTQMMTHKQQQSNQRKALCAGKTHTNDDPQTATVQWGKGSMCWKNTHKWWPTNSNGPVRERLYVASRTERTVRPKPSAGNHHRLAAINSKFGVQQPQCLNLAVSLSYFYHQCKYTFMLVWFILCSFSMMAASEMWLSSLEPNNIQLDCTRMMGTIKTIL